MTSAELTEAEPERTIDLGAPITGISPTGESRSLVLRVYFDQEGLFGPQRSVSWGDLRIRADGEDLVVLRGSREVRRLAGHSTRVTAVDSFTRAGEPLLVSGSEGGSVRVWSLRTGDCCGGAGRPGCP
ncbi:hypothetical protein [Lentzea sp. HUAS12]|uniref:hypothetical protein n=1 Tax=Lentzea sp. HUAS12 TaxID=2951806 RepID=UPI00209E9A67|nr:hypothetical protein [Lentzea sp. HUAS12]USX48532.1 hypothetical protein ND450_23945 [Lentzea sp. HUAS12]